MNERGKSDNLVVPAKPPNKTGEPVAEVVEGRRLARGTRPGRHARTQCRVRRAKRAGPCARGSTKGQGRTVHRAAAPRRPGSPVGGLCGDQPEGSTRCRPGDVGRLRAGPPGEPRRPAPPCPQRCLPGEPFSQGVHPETGRAAAPARHRHLGGQDPPACGGGGAELCVRGGLSRFLLRVPARAWPARCAGCARGRDLREEGELDTRR